VLELNVGTTTRVSAGQRFLLKQGGEKMDQKKRASMMWLMASALMVLAHQTRAAADTTVLRIYVQAAPGQKAAANKDSKTSAATAPVASYDMAFLKSLPQHSISTHTPWYKNAVTFTGPLVRDVLAAAKVKGDLMYAIAADDYRVKIPFSDCVQYDMILAHQMDGVALTAKDKGPLFVVYPYDSKPELQSIRFYERSVWQLKSLRVE